MAASDKDLHREALEAFDQALEAAQENRESYVEDYKFGFLGEQWDEKIAQDRKRFSRPMLTINGLPAFGRQVINDIRQNRPRLKVLPADSDADIETATVIRGLLRNIENNSKASIAYETAAECSVYGGFGYWRVAIEHASDDTFDQDIVIKRIANPLSVVGDPYGSLDGTSADWNIGFIGELMSKRAFEDAYPDADPVSFDNMEDRVRKNWTDGDEVLVCEYWKREKVAKTIWRMSNGQAVAEEALKDPMTRAAFEAAGIMAGQSRQVMSFKVKQCILNGQQVLTQRKERVDGKEQTFEHYDWPGKYIPIIEMVGVEKNLEGKRILRSMINDAKDAQRQVNYWTTTATELVALAPRVPYIGPKGAFKSDKRWKTANSQNHPYLEYDGSVAPARQPIDSGPAAGAMQEALLANDNIKKILGMYDASLGARSNETSGKAIDARKEEGDTSTFNWRDNLGRAIQHGGVVMMDLIPYVYTKERVIRVLGEDGETQAIRLGERQRVEQPMQPGQQPKLPRIGALDGVFDLAMGKYDVIVDDGPSSKTERRETVEILGDLVRSNPAIMQVAGDLLVKNIDGLKDADELARRLKAMLPPNLQDDSKQQIPPQVQAAMQQHEQMIQALTEENQKLKQDEIGKAATIAKAQSDKDKNDIERQKTALAMARVPIEADQAARELILAEKDLLLTQARLLQQATQPTQEPTPSGPSEDVLVLAEATGELARSLAARRVKRTTMQKVNGQWVGETVDATVEEGAAP